MNKTMNKEMEKAIKHGSAYRNWKKRYWGTCLGAFAWIFLGLLFCRLNLVLSILYIIGDFVIAMLVIYVTKNSCWKCPQCKGKLPANSGLRTQNVQIPYLIENCPYCGFDLTR